MPAKSSHHWWRRSEKAIAPPFAAAWALIIGAVSGTCRRSWLRRGRLVRIYCDENIFRLLTFAVLDWQGAIGLIPGSGLLRN